MGSQDFTSHSHHNPTLHTAALAALEASANQALTLDPATQQRLGELGNHCFHLQCTAPQLNVYLIPGPDKLRLCSMFEGEPDTCLKGSAGAFMELLSSSNPASTLINSTLELHGDSNALIKLQNIAKQLDLDWEAPLCSIFGDIAGHQIGRGIRHSLRFGKQLLSGLRRQVEDYVIEESNTMPARWEVEKFYNQVDQLAIRTERLAAKINKYRQRNATKQ